MFRSLQLIVEARDKANMTSLAKVLIHVRKKSKLVTVVLDVPPYMVMEKHNKLTTILGKK